MTETTDVVRDFCAAWSKLDIDRIVGYFPEDAVYHDIPVDPVVGRDTIGIMIARFTAGWDRVDFELSTIAAPGNIVLAERVDRSVSAERVVALPVMGTFETEDDRMRAWRDYLDLNQFTSQLTS